MNTIIVAISAGVATIYNVPRGVEVVVADFDTQGVDAELLSDSPVENWTGKCWQRRYVHNHNGKEAVELL